MTNEDHSWVIHFWRAIRWLSLNTLVTLWLRTSACYGTWEWQAVLDHCSSLFKHCFSLFRSTASTSARPERSVTASTSAQPERSVTASTSARPERSVTASTSARPERSVTASTSERPERSVTACTSERPERSVTACTSDVKNAQWQSRDCSTNTYIPDHTAARTWRKVSIFSRISAVLPSRVNIDGSLSHNAFFNSASNWVFISNLS